VTQRSTPLRFRFHVAMAGVLGIGGDIVKWPDADLALARELIALYRDIRPVVQHGELYRLRPPVDDGLVALQYVHRDRSVVFAYRQAAHFNAPARPLRLAALDPAARYHDPDSGRTHSGAVLLGHGLALDLPGGDFASTVVRLDRA
ncbi:MAG TPA: GH36 C-terminal domain-containing protein, partial [Amycolatopsis sp.]|nr:GH36 C-terminal domain-containing protein [Amycolatopsis sp.]